ncbi:protein TolR [Marinivivus vitaminiproducens]|uniref:protein TolR n=1 Tax=Marinivivus vitaminiproducens TaxID=3035935 RepID=UPI00279F3230|nr:protein TolR [Geminicoccaceae bacterium SCSIO 64248]
MAGGVIVRGSSVDDHESGYAPMAEINVTPFVDVMLVLLIIFMVAAPLMTVGVPVNLPKTAAARTTEPQEPLIISVNDAGEIFVGEDPLSRQDLQARLQALAGENAERPVLLRGDSALGYGKVMEVMGDINVAGFSKISLLAEAGPQNAQAVQAQ